MCSLGKKSCLCVDVLDNAAHIILGGTQSRISRLGEPGREIADLNNSFLRVGQHFQTNWIKNLQRDMLYSSWAVYWRWTRYSMWMLDLAFASIFWLIWTYYLLHTHMKWKETIPSSTESGLAFAQECWIAQPRCIIQQCPSSTKCFLVLTYFLLHVDHWQLFLFTCTYFMDQNSPWYPGVAR